ncbi:MAG: glucose-6-phosphate isomerase, partial [Halalkalicoccus sp.]
MEIDIGNALDSVATPGVSRETLERLDDRVGTAHGRIETAIGEREHGYAALALPETAAPDAIRAAVDPIDCDTLLVVGIGGSALGAATIADALSLDIDVYT